MTFFTVPTPSPLLVVHAKLIAATFPTIAPQLVVLANLTAATVPTRVPLLFMFANLTAATVPTAVPVLAVWTFRSYVLLFENWTDDFMKFVLCSTQIVLRTLG